MFFKRANAGGALYVLRDNESIFLKNCKIFLASAFEYPLWPPAANKNLPSKAGNAHKTFQSLRSCQTALLFPLQNPKEIAKLLGNLKYLRRLD